MNHPARDSSFPTQLRVTVDCNTQPKKDLATNVASNSLSAFRMFETGRIRA